MKDLIHKNFFLIEDLSFDILYSLLRRMLCLPIRFLWIKNVVGFDKIPKKGGVILAMNHQSYFDFLCLAAVSPRNIHFLAAEKFFEHWLWRYLMKVTKQVRVNRFETDKKEMHNLVHDHLEQKRVIGIFPEGTRSPHEHEMLKAFTGVAQYGLLKKVPIIPIGIKGTFSVMSKYDRRPHLVKRVEIIIGDPIHFLEYHKRNDLTHVDYNAVTHKVMKEISILSGKSYPHKHD